MPHLNFPWFARWIAVVALGSNVCSQAVGSTLTGAFSSIAQGSDVNLTVEGKLDWVHWGLYTEASLDRKAGVVPQLSDFTLLDNSNGFAYVYQYADNFNGYSWSDGTPSPAFTNTTTGVWAYGTPQIDSGFQITAPADTATRTLKVYVGAYGARGRFEAFMGDGSARGYTNTSLFNMANGPSGVYTVSYAAASAAQQLTVRWTLAMPVRPDGNVTLQAAALTSSNANNLPFTVLTTPSNNANFSANGDITLTATANDVDGMVTNVEFFVSDAKVGEDANSPYSTTWSNAPAGVFSLTARATDNLGGVSTSSPVEIFVHGNGGSLAGGITLPPGLPAAVNLTSEGTRDWAHWGFTPSNRFNHKVTTLQQISDFAKIGTNVVEIYADNYTGYSWSDGTPTPTANNTTTGVFTTGLTNGFEITVPADTTPRTLKVYVGLYGAQGNFQAWLSDFSGPAYGDTTLSNYFGNAYAVYTLTYAAASSGQTLTAKYRSLNLFDRDFGNVTLQAATLSVNSVGNLPPTVQMTEPTNGAVLVAPATLTLLATANDSDGSVSQVEFFNGSAALGVDTTSPYGAGASNLAAANYIFSAVATDNLGARATNSVSIIVNIPPTVSVISPTNGQSYIAPANIAINADANDTDGAISKVDFFEGTNLLGQALGPSYIFNWSNVVAGAYTLTARATDNLQTTTLSSPVNIVVRSPLPSPTILNPALSTGGFGFSVATVANWAYTVQGTASLNPVSWQSLTNFAGDGSIAYITDNDTSGSQRFYRVLAE